MRWSCWPKFSAATPPAASTAGWWSMTASRPAPAPTSIPTPTISAPSASMRVPPPGTDAAIVEKATDEEIARLLRDGVTEAELAAAKKALLSDAIKARDSVAGPARIIGASLTTGSTIEDIEEWPDRIQAVTADAGQDRRGESAADQLLGDRHAAAERRRAMTGILAMIGRCPRAAAALASRRPVRARLAGPARSSCRRSPAPAGSRPGWSRITAFP